MSPNEPNGRNRAQWAQMGPNGPKWIQLGPMGPNGPEWAQWTRAPPHMQINKII